MTIIPCLVRIAAVAKVAYTSKHDAAATQLSVAVPVPIITDTALL